MFDPFHTLGLSPDVATYDDARQKYRLLARQHHPDQGGDEEAMAQVTRAWREIKTPEKMEEMAKVILARRSAAVRKPQRDAHMHDVRTQDGIVHLGPYTKGACATEADFAIKDLRWAHRIGKIKSLLKGKISDLGSKFTAPEIIIPHSFSLTADRVYFYTDGVAGPGSALLCAPSMRRDEHGTIGYSGMAAQSLQVEISSECTGLIGLGQTLVRGDNPPDAVLVFEGS
jgi:hypothetical protein